MRWEDRVTGEVSEVIDVCGSGLGVILLVSSNTIAAAINGLALDSPSTASLRTHMLIEYGDERAIPRALVQHVVSAGEGELDVSGCLGEHCSRYYQSKEGE